MSVAVKICSITSLDDALAALNAGADYLGFIGVPNTPRYVTPHAFIHIARGLPPSTKLVVVVRDAPDGLVYGGRRIQYYGGDIDAIPAYIELTPVIRPRTKAELKEQLAKLPRRASSVLVDAYHQAKLGGASVLANWDLAAEAVRHSKAPVFLAGGLTPENVAHAVAKVKPFGVDVSSGVELHPGTKDHERVRSFIGAAKSI